MKYPRTTVDLDRALADKAAKAAIRSAQRKGTTGKVVDTDLGVGDVRVWEEETNGGDDLSTVERRSGEESNGDGDTGSTETSPE